MHLKESAQTFLTHGHFVSNNMVPLRNLFSKSLGFRFAKHLFITTTFSFLRLLSPLRRLLLCLSLLSSISDEICPTFHFFCLYGCYLFCCLASGLGIWTFIIFCNVNWKVMLVNQLSVLSPVLGNTVVALDFLCPHTFDLFHIIAIWDRCNGLELL